MAAFLQHFAFSRSPRKSPERDIPRSMVKSQKYYVLTHFMRCTDLNKNIGVYLQKKNGEQKTAKQSDEKEKKGKTTARKFPVTDPLSLAHPGKNTPFGRTPHSDVHIQMYERLNHV